MQAAAAVPGGRESGPFELRTFTPEAGFCFTTNLAVAIVGDSQQQHDRSTLQLLENGARLGPAHAPHRDIRERGGGRYSHWGDAIYLSTSDNSDPRTNGRVYYAYITDDADLPVPLRSLPDQTLEAGPPTPIVHDAVAAKPARRHYAERTEGEVEILETAIERGSGAPRYILKPPFVADGGAAWMAALPAELHSHTDIDGAPSRSPLRLLEDGILLGAGHSLHQRIRDEGRGLYSFWKTGLWFSTSDGSNPNTNGRLYSVAPDPDAPPLRFPEPSAAAEAAPERPNVAASDALDQVFPLRRGAEVLYRVFGERRLTRCPVCNGGDATQLWRIPMANIDPPISLFGGYFNQVPTLQVPGVVFCFDFCPDCESIFLNPVPASQKQEYRDTDHYIRKMETAAEWQGYEDVYDSFAKWIPSEATVMVDAACGIGQYLHVARRRGTHNWRRMIGLELAEKYVDRMRAEGFEAHAFDIDNDDLSVLVAPNSIDFITFSEAFEHVERPLEALRKLVGVLRPGGRLYFSAQRYGRDVQAAVRPAEPIYIGEKVVKEMPDRLGCRIVDIRTSSMRYFIVLEK